MTESFVFGDSLAEAYHYALEKLYKWGDESNCADWACWQKELTMTMVVENPLSEPMYSNLFIGGPEDLEQYRQEMLDGILDFECENGKWAYTYHSRMVNCRKQHTGDWLGEQWIECDYPVNQIGFVVSELRRNPSSRRAVVDIRTADDIGSNEPACLQHIQYFIRDGKLHCKVLFRSNDACKATYMNAYALIMLQKRIADELGVEVGTYTHRANSFHCYERDYDLLEGYCKRLEEDRESCYADTETFEMLMEEAKPKIAAKVEELRRR